jgi:hypothetical protein
MIRRSGDRVSYSQCAALIATAGLLGASGSACSMVSFGELPLKLSAISGTVGGNSKYEDASKPLRRLSGVRVQLLKRTDRKYSKDVVAKKLRGSLPPGMVWEWSCTDVVATSSSDDSGHFAFQPVDAGKYCLDFEGPEYTGNHARMGSRFLLDVDATAKYRSVMADITPLWPDCSGGRKIGYADEAGAQSKN